MREQEPPALTPRPPADAGDEDAEGLNWELTSLLSALPIQYSYSDSAPDLSPRAAPIVTLPAGAAGPGLPGKETCCCMCCCMLLYVLLYVFEIPFDCSSIWISYLSAGKYFHTLHNKGMHVVLESKLSPSCRPIVPKRGLILCNAFLCK